MTVDAILSMLLSVVLPFLLTLLGGILAAKELNSDVEKRWWISGFIFLFILSVVLAFVKQVRDTENKVASERIATEERIRSAGEIKFVQGQLDSINKVLGMVSANSSPQQIIGAIRSALPVSQDTRPALERMSNKQLRMRVSEFADSMIDFEGRFKTNELARRNRRDAERRDAERKTRTTASIEETRALWTKEREEDTQFRRGWEMEFTKTYRPNVVAYQDELLRRLGPQPVGTGMSVPILLLYEAFAGPKPIEDAAIYLKVLANKLPN